MVKLNLGCGIYVKKGWINVDNFFTEEELKKHTGKSKYAIFEKGAKYVQADICKMPFPDNYADLIEAHEVMEHIPMDNIFAAFKEIYRVLKKGGKFLMHSPSFNGIVIDWLRMSYEISFDLKHYFNIAQLIYGNQFHEGELHRTPINDQFLNYLLVKSGFTNGTIYVYYKGTKAPRFGAFRFHKRYIKKGAVLRNDTIVAECTK
jgi:ubiquinone/menaquinone biosynthesis C-methylase UbiE